MQMFMLGISTLHERLFEPSLKENQYHFVFHVDTNDVDSNQSSDLIAKPIVDIISNLKFDGHHMTISNIITRNDRFMTQANKVNKCLTELCFEIFY